MPRFTQRVVMLFTLLSLPSAVLAGTTYNIHNYPDQNGWTLTGTITTDGKQGLISAADITSWTWTITKGDITNTFTSTSPGATTTVESSVLASSTDLTLPFPGDSEHGGPINFLELSTDSGFIGWQYIGFGTSGVVTYAAAIPPNGTLAWSTRFDDISDSFLIASVPEPSALYLLGFGAVCGSVYVMGHRVMGHKRRERRTETIA